MVQAGNTEWRTATTSDNHLKKDGADGHIAWQGLLGGCNNIRLCQGGEASVCERQTKRAGTTPVGQLVVCPVAVHTRRQHHASAPHGWCALSC